MAPPRSWAVTGPYFEACNCEAICPCRTIGSRKGGLSTYGVCDFVLGWTIAEEVVAELLAVDDDPLRFDFRGRCGFATSYAYRSG